MQIVHFVFHERRTGKACGSARGVGGIQHRAGSKAGRPIFGIDFDDSVLPAETGQLQRAVSLTKGCYLGQEITWPGCTHGVRWRTTELVGFRMQEDALPIMSRPIVDELQEIKSEG